MQNISFCPNCFREGFNGRCAYCNYIALQNENHMLLSPGTMLKGRYQLGRVLGAGGFGITYLARDDAGKLCAVKEYLPSMLAVRDSTTKKVYPSSSDNKETFEHGLKVFNKESQVLRRFENNPNIVQVFDCFEENGTAYFVMEFLDGVNLQALTRSMGNVLPPEYGTEILFSVAGTLKAVHAQGLLHRDISPENIFMTKQGTIKLIDFGATRFFVGEKSRSLSVILKPGFAPPEQYSSKGNQGPWTDIYALCATIYNVLTGAPLPDAPERLSGTPLPSLSSLVAISPAMSKALERGLALDYRMRPQTVDEFLLEISASEHQAASVKASEVKGTPYIQIIPSGDKWIIPKNIPMAIGRSSERCNIVLDEPNVSRVHCTVQYDDKTNVFYLIDLSSNGTFADSGRLEQNKAYSLNPNENFYILNHQITMRVGVE